MNLLDMLSCLGVWGILSLAACLLVAVALHELDAAVPTPPHPAHPAPALTCTDTTEAATMASLDAMLPGVPVHAVPPLTVDEVRAIAAPDPQEPETVECHGEVFTPDEIRALDTHRQRWAARTVEAR